MHTQFYLATLRAPAITLDVTCGSARMRVTDHPPEMVEWHTACAASASSHPGCTELTTWFPRRMTMRAKKNLGTEAIRPAKRLAGRAPPGARPAFIRAVGVTLGADDRAYVRRKLDRKLGKFSRRIERTSVRIDDVNGPRGGIDKRCRIKVVLTGLPSVVVEERHHSLQAAIDGALARVERAVRQAADSRRTRPRRRRRLGAPPPS